jgi:RNA polymerase sigma-70 factor (ECF subfamily)
MVSSGQDLEMTANSFADLMKRLRAGDQKAAAELFERFSGRLMILAQDRLGPLTRGKVDAEDVVLSALKSFFHRFADGRLDPQGWAGLWALLTTITLRKCGHHVDYWLAACRDVRRETDTASLDAANIGWQAVATEPTPSQAAMLVETVQQLEKDLEDYHRDIFRLALAGYTPTEIGSQVSVTERTVQRVLQRIRGRLEAMAD